MRFSFVFAFAALILVSACGKENAGKVRRGSGGTAPQTFSSTPADTSGTGGTRRGRL